MDRKKIIQELVMPAVEAVVEKLAPKAEVAAEAVTQAVKKPKYVVGEGVKVIDKKVGEAGGAFKEAADKKMQRIADEVAPPKPKTQEDKVVQAVKEKMAPPIDELEKRLNNLKLDTDTFEPAGKNHRWANVKSVINMRFEEMQRPKAKAKYTPEEWRERVEDALNMWDTFRKGGQ